MRIDLVVGERPESEDDAEAQEEEPDHLVPQRVDRLDYRRRYMFDELTAVPDRLTLPHSFILTNSLRDAAMPRIAGGAVPILTDRAALRQKTTVRMRSTGIAYDAGLCRFSELQSC